MRLFTPMHFRFIKNQPTVLTRVTALAATLLILALVVFSAYPALHAWIHSAESKATDAFAAKHSAAHPASHESDSDDSCAVVLFAHGVLAAMVTYLIGRFFGALIDQRTVDYASIGPLSPRYWLPPLCGPPLK